MTSFSFIPLNASEIKLWVDSVQFLVGARLQQAFWTEDGIKLHFFKQGSNYLVIFDLQQALPFAYLEMQSAKKGSAHKPLLLFMKAHFYGKILNQVIQTSDSERSVQFCFDKAELTAQLIPHSVNFSARTNESVVYFRKPREISDQRPPSSNQPQALEARPLEEVLSSYLDFKKIKKGDAKIENNSESTSPSTQLSRSESVFNKERAKLEKLILKLDLEISEKQKFDFSPFEAIAHKIQATGLHSLEDSERAQIKNPESVRDALDYIYSLTKKNEIKLNGVKLRRSQLLDDLEALKSKSLESTHPHHEKQPKSQKNLLEISDAKGRTLKSDQTLFYVGKSAADNLALLRKAQPHDYWIHLREYPSAHGILRSSKKQVPALVEIKKCAQFLIKNTFAPDKWNTLSQSKFEIIYAECRHVRPIKGGALGTVIYRNEKSFLLTFDPTQV